jgi:7,8-dihydropterin-6-yl-methyl-4-(beta-D-ribofuranosyl)aminobenzene 5'-phosphate synthase
MRTAILTLVENSVQKLGLTAEHGLSLLVAVPGGNILFDTGQGMALIPNARRMGIDLTTVSKIVLSHGHCDHTGGLLPLLKEAGPRPVVAHPAVFRRRYSEKSGERREIGIPATRETIEKAASHLLCCTQAMPVAPGVLATGPIPRLAEFESIPPHFLTDTPDGSGCLQDFIEDDQALIVEDRNGPVLVLGCGHSGLLNTLRYASELTGTRKFSLVIGGTHLIDADEERLKKTLESIREFDIAAIAPCHCTGFAAQIALREAFGPRFRSNGTGDRIDIGV